jgi:hypothetical protein
LEIFEIYNEEIYDLMTKDRKKLELKHINYTDQAVKSILPKLFKI